MVKPTVISETFKFKQRLIDNKPFLVNIERSKTKKKIEKLLKSATISELDILRDLIKNIAAKNIPINKSIINSKKKFDNIVSLISSFERTSSIHSSKVSLRRFLLKLSNILPVIAKSFKKYKPRSNWFFNFASKQSAKLWKWNWGTEFNYWSLI